MTIKDLIGDIHRKLQVKLKKDLSYDEISKLIDVKARTYQNWRDGSSSPRPIIHFMNFISKLDDEQILDVVKSWREEEIGNE